MQVRLLRLTAERLWHYLTRESQGLQNSTLAAVWPSMELSANVTDRDTMINTFMQQYMSSFAENHSFEKDGTNTADVIKEAILLHQQVRAPLHALPSCRASKP